MSKYTLEKPTERNMFFVTIVADSNDGDYITREGAYTKGEFDEYVADALIDLKVNWGGSHELQDYHNEYDLSIPYNGFDGFCHTLKSVTVTYIDENGDTYNVELRGLEDESEEES